MTTRPIVKVGDGIVCGVDVDAIVAVVRSCPGVDDLIDGPPAAVATDLRGRRINGIRVETRRVVIQICARPGHDIRQLAEQIQAAASPLTAGRPVDVIVAALRDRPAAPTALPPAACAPPPPDGQRWTNNTPGSVQRVGHSLAPIIPTAAPPSAGHRGPFGPSHRSTDACAAGARVLHRS